MECVSLLHILILPQFHITQLSLTGQGGFMSDVYSSVHFLAGLTATLTAFFGVFFCLSSKFLDTCCEQTKPLSSNPYILRITLPFRSCLT